MKIALNRCYGGFNLSQECLKIIFGELSDVEKDKFFYPPYERNNNNFTSDREFVVDGMGWYPKYHDTGFRTHPAVIQAIEVLGDKASGPWANVEVVNVETEIEINGYGGMESVRIGGFRVG